MTPIANPFVGVRSFEPHESILFHGRKTHTQQLLRVLGSHRFVGVVGTSGSGKSSLVKAGLLPALYRGYLRGATSRWKTAVMRPGPAPLARLAEALSDARDGLGLPEPAPEVTRKLAANSAALAEVVRERLDREQENLLVVVDQFEEIFRTRDEADVDGAREAAFFVSLILQASEELTVPIYVVLTIRSEFLGECSRHPGLPEALSEAQYLIPRLTREQSEEAIRGPLEMVGTGIEDALVQQLLNDAGNDPDQLPALQHALMKLYEKRAENEPLTLSLYQRHQERLRVGRSLNTHAEEVLESVPLQTAERVFRCLTVLEDGREIRRPTTLAKLEAVAGAYTEEACAEVRAVVSAFAARENSLLFISTGEMLTDESWIDITHESLIRQWDRLREWVKLEATSADWFGRLVQSARLRREGNAEWWGARDVAFAYELSAKNLWSVAWSEQYYPAPSLQEAMAFLGESQDAIGAREVAERRQAVELEELRAQKLAATERELVATKRGRSKLLWLSGGLVLATAGLLYFATKWREERQRVDELRQTGAGSQLEIIAELRNRIAVLSKTETGRVTVNPKDGLRHVSIPAGEFTIGCSPGDSECDQNEKPSHPVQIGKPFVIGQTEVTQAAYEKLIKKNPSNFKGSDRPVESVSWRDAEAYCRAVDMRLPTEAEWEYAARAGRKEARCGKLAEIAWHLENSSRSTQPAATKLPNDWGLYDTLGNVWEWTADRFENGYYSSSPKADPTGPATGEHRVLRGGSWGSDPRGVRVSNRNRFDTSYRSIAMGFRCAGELR